MDTTSGVMPDASMRWCWESAPRIPLLPAESHDFRLRFSEEGYPEIICSMRAMVYDPGAPERMKAVFWYVRDRFAGGPEGLDKVLTRDAHDWRSRVVQLRPKITAEVEADDAPIQGSA
jgi:hypothetical protein